MPVKRGNGERSHFNTCCNTSLVQQFSAEALLSGLSIVGGESKWKCFVIFFFKCAVSL